MAIFVKKVAQAGDRLRKVATDCAQVIDYIYEHEADEEGLLQEAKSTFTVGYCATDMGQAIWQTALKP